MSTTFLYFAAAVFVSTVYAIKLIPVQRTYRTNVKSTERSTIKTQAAASSSNEAVVDQLQTVKKVLSNADILRSELNDLVGEFTLADIPRKKVNVYMRSQKIIETFLNKILTKDSPRTDDKGNSNDLRLQIRKALEREYGYYLEIMDGIMQNGWSHLQAATTESQGRVDPIVTETTNASFKSREEVKQIFLQWYERLDKSKRTEKVASKAKATTVSFWYVGMVIVLIVMAGCGWWFYNLSAGARNRKRQIQRKIFLSKMIQLSAKWSTKSYKFAVTAMNFLLFLLSGLLAALRPFWTKILSFISAARNIKLSKVLKSSTGPATPSTVSSPRRRKVVKSKTDDREIIHKDTCMAGAEDAAVDVGLGQGDSAAIESLGNESWAEVKDANGREIWTTNIYSSGTETTETEIVVNGRDSPSSVVDRNSFEVVEQTDIELYMKDGEAEVAAEEAKGSSAPAAPVLKTVDRPSDIPNEFPYDRAAFEAVEEDGWNTALPTKVRGRKVRQQVRSNSVPKSRQSAPVTKVKSPLKKPLVVEKQKPAALVAPAVAAVTATALTLQTLQPVASHATDDSDTSASDLTADSGYATAAGETIYRSQSAPLQEYRVVESDIYQQPYDGTNRSFSAPLQPAYYYAYTTPVPNYIPMSPMDMQMYYAGQPPVQYVSYPSPDTVMAPAYYQMQMPVNQVMGEESLTEAVKAQVEYYFSAENLCKDMYLRKRMDAAGFVLLGEVAQFKRMQQINAPPAVIMQALKASSQLEVVLPWAAKVSPDQLSDGAILDSKIRCAEGWERWVLPANGNTTPKAPRLMEEIQP